MRLPALCALSFLLAASPIAAHEVKSGPNGGRVVEAGDFHVEMVAKNNTIDVFLTDHNDKAVAATGYTGPRYSRHRRQESANCAGAGGQGPAVGSGGRRDACSAKGRCPNHAARRQDGAGQVRLS